MNGCINMPTASRHIIRVWIWELVVQVASMMNGSMQKCCLAYPILDRFKLGKLVILPTISTNDTRCCLLVKSWSSHEQLGDDGYITTLTTHDSFSWLNYGDRMWLVVDQSLTRVKVFSFFLTRTPLVSLFCWKEMGKVHLKYHLIKIILDLDISGIHPCLFGKESKGIDWINWPFRTEDLGSIAEVTLLFGSTSRDLCHLAKHWLSILASSSGELVRSWYNIP